MGPTHVRKKGQNLKFYLETHATTQDIYLILLRNLVQYTGVWMTLNCAEILLCILTMAINHVSYVIKCNPEESLFWGSNISKK